ncbi:MAG: protein phosphatase 2C domain-containing protein [Pseudomonadota bacterium]
MYQWKQLTPSVPHQLALGVAFGMTDVGTVRRSNEDNFLIDAGLGLLAVADGMGGHAAGEVASSDALNALASFIRAARSAEHDADSDATRPRFRPSNYDPSQADPDATWTDATMGAMIVLHDAVEFANERVYQNNLATDQADGGGMGTTLTGLWQPAPDGPLFVFHVGDSRLYRLRNGWLAQITRDQTMYQQAIEAGSFENLPPRNLLLQAVGPDPIILPELQSQAVAPGDVYMLCSDGLYGHSDDEALADVLARADGENLQVCCERLIEMAKRDGSRDNITVVLLYCKQQAAL